MRITSSLFYSTSTNEHQNAMKQMYNINTQISSGMKIQNSYEDSGIYVDTMRLNYEIATLEQSKETSSKAQTFAKNTDSTMNQFATALDKFKSKLIQANSSSNSSTSLNALANELQSIKEHLISLGNTSINGQFLFSGTSLLQKPLTSDGGYVGNDENLTAIIGSGVELPYNITGKDLFLGKDSDYNRIVSTNVPMFNQTKLHPEVMVESGNSSSSQEVYLKDTDTIRDMIGDTDSDITNDPQSVFYLSGRKTDGITFSTKITMDSDSKISDLLESIGTAYGNTSTNKVVDVSMNAHGQIELKDLKTGNQLLEMHLVGAVDRNAIGISRNADIDNITPIPPATTTTIDDLLRNPNVDIITFNKSNFDSLNAASAVSLRENIYQAGTFTIGSPMKLSDGSAVNTSTLLRNFMGSTIDTMVLSGFDDAGVALTSPADDFSIGVGTTVQDLMTHLENRLSTTAGNVTARLENGQIIIVDETLSTPSSFGTSNLEVTLTSEAGGTTISAFSILDGLNYARRGFEKEGNELLGNISQIINKKPLDTTKVSGIGEYASASTTLYEVAGSSSLDTKRLLLNGISQGNVPFSVQIDLLNTGSTFSLDGGVTNYTIFNSEGNPTQADKMTYQQLMDVISMVTANSIPSDTDLPTDGIQLDEYNTAISAAKNSVEVTLDYKGRIAIKDKTASESKIEFTMYESLANDYSAGSEGSVLSFMANDSVTISNPSIDFFKDLDAMIEAVRTGNFRMGTVDENPRNTGMQNALLQLDHILDHVTKEHTKIGAYTNALSDATDRAEYLSLNVKTVRTEVIGVDVAEAYLQFNQISNSYQAMLSTISKINSMSLLNYM